CPLPCGAAAGRARTEVLRMRSMVLALAGALLLGQTALAAPGDVLTVTGDRVNVRAGPGTEHAVVRQVARAQRLVEIERQGDWVHAEIAGTDGGNGWIHASLVARGAEAGDQETAPAAEPAPPLGETSAAATPEMDPLDPDAIAPGAADVDAVDLQRFRASVDYLNSRALLL